MRRRAITAAAVAAVVLLAIVAGRDRLQGGPPAPRYRTAEVTRGDLVLSVAASGTVEAVALVEVKSRATGQVRAVFVDEGTSVRRGQALVEIDDPDARAALENARIALAAARARLAQAEASVALTRSSTSSALRQAEANVAAARARLAQTQAGRPEEIAQAEEALRQARASEALARQDLERHEQLFRDGFVARSALDQARSRHEVAASQVTAAEFRLDQVRSGGSAQEVQIARAQLAQAEAALAEARNGALQVRARMEDAAAARAQAEQAAAVVRQAEERLGESRIAAPIDGVVVKLSVAVGQSVIGSSTGGTPVLTLAQLSPVRVKVFVDEADITRVTPRAQVEVSADALPGVVLRGRVVGMAPQPVVEQNVTRYPVTVEVDDRERALRLGMTVDATFVLARRANVLLVPQEAVRGRESQAVFIVDGTRLVPRLVQTGLTDGRLVEVRSGLREGELVYLGAARAAGTPPRSPGRTPFQPRFAPRR